MYAENKDDFEKRWSSSKNTCEKTKAYSASDTTSEKAAAL